MNRQHVAIVGASGYTGMELVRLLAQHPDVELVAVTSRSEVGRTLGELFPRLRRSRYAALEVIPSAVDEIIATGATTAFLALPHGAAAAFAKELLAAGLRVIDLSADFRIRKLDRYENFYGPGHPAPELLAEAVYGLPEIYGDKLATARLVAAPGCYPTSILLPLLPLVRAGLIDHSTLVVCSMSGVSGAGRKAELPLLFVECHESLRAYGLPTHRHLAEIEQELGEAAGTEVKLTFVPHLVPVNSGIHTTITATLVDGARIAEVSHVLECAYAKEPFVRLLGRGGFPDTKHVTRSNFIDIGWHLDERTGRLVLLSAIDNLGKGAGSQAIEAFNLMHGFKRTAGLCP